MKDTRKWGSLLFFLALCFSIAWAGSIATQSSLSDWYIHIKKPSWNPPAWIFPPVWSLLYFLMAIAGWTIYRKKKSIQRKKALQWYFLQLFFNAIWSFLFFYFRNPLLGFIDIIFLVLAAAMTLLVARKVSKSAFILLLPYFLWITFAAVLNGAILAKNIS